MNEIGYEALSEAQKVKMLELRKRYHKGQGLRDEENILVLFRYFRALPMYQLLITSPLVVNIWIHCEVSDIGYSTLRTIHIGWLSHFAGDNHLVQCGLLQVLTEGIFNSRIAQIRNSRCKCIC